MAIIVSMTTLAPFMKCPALGATALGPEPSYIPPPISSTLPVITGDLTVGATLTTTNGIWNTTHPATYTYQWMRNGVNIFGGTYQTYVTTQADVGAYISVTVTIHSEGSNIGATALPVGPVSLFDDTTGGYGLLNSDLPIITGVLRVGQTLTTTDGGWVGTLPITYAYSWQRDGVDIPGATSKTYVIVSADVGHLMTSRVIATNVSGSLSAYSGAYGPVFNLNATTLPTISGAIAVGSTLTVSTGTWTNTPPITYAYQWQRNGVAISGATTNTYVLTSADVGAMINVIVTATDAYATVSATANSVGPIVDIVDTMPPVISGMTVVGSTLTVMNGTWTGTPPITYTYQWKRAGVNIAGATLQTYVLVSADAGKMISATVTATNIDSSVSIDAVSVGPITDLINTALPIISGTLTVGSTLTTTNGTWTGTPTITYTYQWKNGGANIAGAASQTYVLASADAGAIITVTVKATDTYGNASATANSVGPVAALTLSSSTVLQTATIGTTIGTFSVIGGTGTYVYALTDPSGQFVISGSNLNVATALTGGNYPITVQATGGVPSPVSNSFMITVVAIAAKKARMLSSSRAGVASVAVTDDTSGKTQIIIGVGAVT